MLDQAMSAVGFARPSAAAGAFIEYIDWFGVRTNVRTLAFRFQSFCSNQRAMKNLATASGTIVSQFEMLDIHRSNSAAVTRAGAVSALLQGAAPKTPNGDASQLNLPLAATISEMHPRMCVMPTAY